MVRLGDTGVWNDLMAIFGVDIGILSKWPRGGVGRQTAMWFARYIAYWLVAVPACILAGAVPDQHLYWRYDARFGDLPICASIIALVLGFVISRKWPDPAGQWVFLPGLLLFADGVYESSRSWSFPTTASAQIQFLIVNALGVKPGCEGDCFNVGALVLMPSLAYSIGTFLGIRIRRRFETARSVR